MAWDDTKTANDDFTSSDWNDMVTELKLKVKSPVTETKLGSNCSGSDGNANRTFTLASASADIHSQGFSIWINGTPLHEGAGLDFTRTTNVLTFLNKIWDVDKIQINYFKY